MCTLLAAECRWVDIVAEYLTALGTVGAVIVALYFAGKDRREKVAVSPAIHIAVQEGQTLAQGIRLFGLTATNVGFAPLTVQKLCWRVGVFRKTVLYVDPPVPMNPSQRIPRMLPRGDWVIVQQREDQFISGLTFLLEELNKSPFPRWALRSLRAGVETSTRKRFFGRPNWDLAKVLREQFDAFRKSQLKR